MTWPIASVVLGAMALTGWAMWLRFLSDHSEPPTTVDLDAIAAATNSTIDRLNEMEPTVTSLALRAGFKVREKAQG